MRGHNLAQERVQATGRNTRIPRLQRVFQGGHQLVLVPAGLRRNVHARRPLHVRQVALNLALKHVAAILIEGIPLIECQNHRTTRINHGLHDTHILLRDRLGNIQQHHGNLRALQSSLGTQRRVELRTLSHVLATANTRGIHKTPRVAAQLNNLVNRVTSRTSQVIHHGTLRTSQLVQQRRLTHVRATHQSHTTRATQRLRLSEL